MLKLSRLCVGLYLVCLTPALARAQEYAPYVVTYDHYMEELHALEVEVFAVHGDGNGVDPFVGGLTSFEYGAAPWWTTELYLDWQHTNHQGSLFTGFRFENRFRMSVEPHKINPVLYIEFEHLSAADKALKEIVGFDSKEDLQVPNAITGRDYSNEMELRLILSGNIGRWNLSENTIAEKNLSGGPWEFGYAVGFSRMVAVSGRGHCTFCADAVGLGIEAYGGAGTWHELTFRNTSQYIAPTVMWALPSETTIRFSPGWGITDQSVGILIRFGVSQEFDIGEALGKVFKRH